MVPDETSYEPMQTSPTTKKNPPDTTPKILFSEALEILKHDERHLKELEKVLFAMISFWVFVVAMFLHIPSTSMYYQHYGVLSALATSGVDTITNDSPVKFFNIQTIPDIFDWLNDTFIPQVFVTSDYNGVILPKQKWGQVATFNMLLGAVNFEVTSMQQVECKASKYLNNNYLYSSCYDETSTTTDEFSVNFDTNATDVITEVTQKKESGTWINSSTHQIVISVLTFNGELQRYAVTKLQFDFNDGGFIEPSASTTSALLDQYPSWLSIVLDTCVILWFSLFQLVSVVNAIKLRSSKSFTEILDILFPKFSNFWHAFSAITPHLFVYAFYITVLVTQNATTNLEFQNKLMSLRDEGQVSHENLVSVTKSFREFANLAVIQRVLAAIAIFLLSNHFLYTLRDHDRMGILKRTLENATQSIGAFIVTFIVIFVAFAAAGIVLFGNRVKEFSSPLNAMTTCANMSFGDFDFDSIKSIDYSIIYYWSYMAIQTLVLLNIALAIVVEALDRVTQKSAKMRCSLYRRVFIILLQEGVAFLHDELQVVTCRKKSSDFWGKLRVLGLHQKILSFQHHPEYLTASHLKKIFPGASLEACKATINDLVAEENHQSFHKKNEEGKNSNVLGDEIKRMDCIYFGEKISSPPTTGKTNTESADMHRVVEHLLEEKLKPLLEEKLEILIENIHQRHSGFV